MIKILTAMGNPILNEKLQRLEDVFVVGKDIQYQDGILEILEETADIDCLIINNSLPGEIDFYKLIKEIKNIKNNIDMYVFLQEKNENVENYLTSQEIYKIYYLDKISFDEFIKNFETKKKDVLEIINKEINEFKKLILNENRYDEKNSKNSHESYFEKNKEFFKDNYSFVEEKISESFERSEWEEENCNTEKENEELKNDYDEKNIEREDLFDNYSDMNISCKTIAISGSFGAGKSLISSFLSKVISEQNKKTLLIDFDIENSSINTLFGVRKYKEKQTYIDDCIFEIHENLDILCGIDKIINFKEKVNYYMAKEIIERLKENYDFIIIDTSSRIEFKYVKIVLAFCDSIIFLIEPNLLEISKSNKILEVFLNDFNINVDKIKIVFNKENKYKIAEAILEEIFSEFEIIGHIAYEEKYNLFVNKNTNSDFNKTKFEKIYEKLIIKKEEVYANSSVGNY